MSRLITRYITANVCRNVFRKSTKKNQKKNIINSYVLSLLSISSIRPRHGETTLLVPSNRFFSKRTKSEDRFSINRADVGVLNKSPKHDVSLCRYPPPPPFRCFRVRIENACTSTTIIDHKLSHNWSHGPRQSATIILLLTILPHNRVNNETRPRPPPSPSSVLSTIDWLELKLGCSFVRFYVKKKKKKCVVSRLRDNFQI